MSAGKAASRLRSQLCDGCRNLKWSRLGRDQLYQTVEISRGQKQIMNAGNAFSTDIKVRFRDLDAMGHVNKAVFFTYFEQGRLDFFNRATPDGKFPGFFFILAHINCDYLKAVSVDDLLALHMQVGEIGRKSYTFRYAVVDRTDTHKVFATGESVQVCYDYHKNQTLPVSPDLKRLLSQYQYKDLNAESIK